MPVLDPRSPACPSVLTRLLCGALLLSVLSGAHAQTLPNGFTDALVMGGWSEPVGFTFDGNGRMYVWEKQGKVWIVQNGVRQATPLIDISAEVGNWRDHGCLGFALDPQFLTNGRIYLMYAVDRHYLMNFGTAAYNAATNEYFAATIMRITRYTAIGPNFNAVDPNSRYVLVGETRKTGVPMTHESHSTGQLVFGTDGTLLATVGDAGSYNNVDVGSDAQTYFAQALTDSIMRPAENVGAMRAQLVNCLNGKVLRIDPNTGDGVASNPYYDASAPRAPKSRVWAMGLRNPYRMTLRPNSGSTNPADGDPGTLYIGDVGWSTWEELNICYEGGMNFGWPLFEGMDAQSGYMAAAPPDLDAPNPLFGQGACTQPFFTFADLCKQETLVHANGHPNPCNSAQQVPPNIPTFFQSRPSIDWKHGNQSRCATFSGNTPVSFDLDNASSPVPGPRFGGFTSIGGTWLTGNGWPVGYQNIYMHGDYAASWIRRFTVNAQDQTQSVADFATNIGSLVFLKEGPDGALWYVRYNTNEIRKISPLGVTNLPPSAVANQSTQYGPRPLLVNFNGTGSADPENGALTYAWNFGDGGTATGLNASHTFDPGTQAVTSYTVTLTVTDPLGLSNSTMRLVSVNNTPPSVAITSFPNGHHYPVGVDTTYALVASVSDPEHSAAQLSYAWQTILHHNTHVHPESSTSAPAGSTVITGEGCYADDFWYEVKLTVTDAGGLSTTVVDQLLPRCSALLPTALITSSITFGEGPFTANLSGSGSVDNGPIVSYAWDFGDGTQATGANVSKTFADIGDYYVTLTVTDADGNTGSATKVISVLDPAPPQCMGGTGSILREYWTNIAGVNVSDLTSIANFPNTPNGTSFPTTFQAPNAFGDNYGTRMRGYIIAPENGVYYFTLTSDDASILYLSLNADPKYKQSIASVPGWTNDTEYNKYPTQRSAAITLKAGRYYYVEALQKEGTGGDHLTVRWERPSNPTVTIVPGTALARWQNCAPSVSLRVELQGPYDPATKLMRDNLRASALIPAVEPFTGLGFTHVGGGGGETVPPSILAVTGKNAVVDWVLVELRNKTTPSNIVATRSALVQRDGDIVGTNGYQRLLFNVSADNYYITVRHRNHQGIMTSASKALSANEQLVDLILEPTATYGTAARVRLDASHWGLFAGNVRRDNTVKYTGADNDRDPILVQIGGVDPLNSTAGYLQGDVNLDGMVRYTGLNNDRDPILVNIGGSNPIATRTEQLP